MGKMTKGAPGREPNCAPESARDCMPAHAEGACRAKAPTAAELENPYHRIFTRTPSLEALARRAYKAEKQAAERAEKNAKKPQNDS